MVTPLARFAPMLAAEAQQPGQHFIPDWAKGNTVFETFFKGGPVMYPLLAILVVAVAVVLERLVWRTIERVRHDANKLDQVHGCVVLIDRKRYPKTPLWHSRSGVVRKKRESLTTHVGEVMKIHVEHGAKMAKKWLRYSSMGP